MKFSYPPFVRIILTAKSIKRFPIYMRTCFEIKYSLIVRHSLFVTVHPHLNLPHQGGGIQGNNEYSPPLVGGGRGGGGLLRKGFIANGKKAISTIDQAIREYEDVLREMPDCVEAYLKLACAHAEKGILDE